MWKQSQLLFPSGEIFHKYDINRITKRLNENEAWPAAFIHSSINKSGYSW